MKPMRSLLLLVLLFVVSSLVAGCYGPYHRGMGAKGGCCKMMADKPCAGKPCGGKPCMAGATAQAGESQRADVLYSCNCGPECKCNSLSKAPGNCSCGKPLAWGHVVRVEGDEALICSCTEGCQCAVDAKDPSKCGCGKPLKRVSLKDSGLFFCNCGGSCSCNTVTMAAGKCKCGMELKQQ